MTEAAAVAASVLQSETQSAVPEPGKINMKIHFGQGVPVPDHMKGSAVSTHDAIKSQMDNAFRAQGVDEAVLAQRGQPVSQLEYTLAQHKKAALVQDDGWKAKYFAGDTEARRTMATLSIILGSPIKSEESQ